MKKLLLKSEKSLLLMFLLIVTSISRGQTQTYTSSGSFITPAGVTTVQVEAYGAGGGGGYGGSSNKQGGGGGGGGGCTVNNSVSVVAPNSYTITIGAAGNGSTSSGVNGTAGGTTTGTFVSTVTATGGAGGKAYSTGANGGGGGNGTKNGGSGANGTNGSGSGGGGGAAGSANGSAGSVAAGGASGGLSGGAGGAGTTSSAVAGTVGANYGGGGGGGTRNSNGGNGAGGFMKVTYTCPTYALTSISIAGPICGVSAGTVTLTGSTAALPVGSYIVTYDLSGATTASGNTATMLVTSAGSGTFTTSTLNAGTTNITITDLDSSYCSSTISSNNTASVAVHLAPVATAGSNAITCSTSGAVSITAGASATNATGITWTSSGTGTFVNPNSIVTCTYTPSLADITAGSVTITLTATGNAPCANSSSNKTLTIYSPPTAVAGTPVTTCATGGPVNVTAGSSATNQTAVLWTSSGTGTFTNATSLTTCTYQPSAADILAGSVTITLTASNPTCSNATSNKTLTITNNIATANAGSNITTCQTTGAVNICTGASATNYSSVLWTSSGTGTFANATSLTTCTYTPSAADITAGSVTLTLTAVGMGTCGNASSNKTLNISKTMTAVAGSNINICITTTTVSVSTGASATNHTGVVWTTSGTGTFTNPNSLGACSYTPSAADQAAGSVTITLTATNAACPPVASSKTLTINGLATSNAGTAIAACSNSVNVNVTTGATATNYASVVWTCTGTGTFTNASSLTACTYTPSAADIAAGSRTLTLTVTGLSPCGNATSTKTITFAQAPTAVAGTAISTCYSVGAVNVTAGSSATNFAAVTWTSSGTGTFSNAGSLTTCTYTPSLADITAGSVTITLTATGNSGCANAVSNKTMTIFQPPAANAGSNINTCATAGAVNITTGSSASNYTSLAWSSTGTGTFANNTSLTTCTYTPSAADITAGTVSITLTVTNACGSDTSSKTLTIYASPTITSTTPGTRSGAGTVNLGATASAGTIYWYAASTGGSSLGFGTNFTTPSISVTTTYYIEVVNGSCTTSPRVGVTATIIYPEIDVQGNATSIADGDTTPSGTDYTDFGASTSTRTYTIRNTGAGTLNLNGITITGTNAADFAVTTAPSNTIASGSSTTFVVTFTPSGSFTRTATINIDNTDSDENPYDFAISGVGVATEIDIKGNGTTIVDGDSTPSTADFTDFSTVANTRTFTIYNLGNVPLTLGTPVISGTNAADFAITTAPATSVGAYGNTTFVVTFTPSAINNRTATITISNNDANENPYDFAIQGFGVIPEIDIQGNATSIANNDLTPSTTDFTDFSTTTVTRTYTIYNQGNTNLTLGAITFTGTNPGDFAVTTAPVSPITAFGSTTFTVTFTPSATGVRSANINIVNNDSNENPYIFGIQGTGSNQEMDLQGNAVSIVDGDITPSVTDWTDFSTASATRTFTILNSGSMPLTIGAITFTGTNASDFSVTTSPAATVPGYGSTTFVVTFNNGGTGNRTATMNIANNDSNENPYDVAIQATGGTRILTITNQNAVTIADGDTTPSANEQTDFGSVSIASGSVTVTYTIKNTGTAAINLGAATFTGTNASDFSLTLSPATSLAPGGTTNFEISFNPSVKGTKTASFSIVTNGTGLNPYNFDLTGLGVQTYIDTDSDGVTDNMDLDDDNDGIKDIKEQADAALYPLSNFITYTFLNETFGAGKTKGRINVNTPGASTTSCYEDDITTNTNSCGTNSSGVLDDGEYVVNYIITNSNGVSSDPENIHHDLAWTDQLDHTTGDTDGRMAIFNADNTAGTYFYQLIINGVVPNTVTSFNFWVMNIMRQGNLGTSIKPNITVEFRDITGATLIASYNTGDIGRCSATDPTDNTCGPSLSNWLNYSTSVNLGNVTDFMIKIRNNAPGGGGNDFAMDDIVITQNYVDTDGDGVANIFDLDDENDGIPDIEEAGFKAYSNGTAKMDTSSSATWVDANGNGLHDSIDSQISGGTYLVADTDGDGVPNYLDLDSDNDSFFDIDEAYLLNGDGDINGDGKGDLVDTDRDGILDLNDNYVGFGSTAKPYAQDTDGDSIPDYMEVDANNDGVKDITTGLYGSLDANADGKIDGSTDVDKDGLLDSFDTNTNVIGSPRDLNRKLYLDFDGRNDYAENAALLGGLSNATLMAWIDLNSAFSSTGVVVGQDKFHIKVSSSKTLQVVVNGTTLTYGTALTTAQWYHVAATYANGNLTLYLNGKSVANVAISGAISADATKLTIGRYPGSATNYFKGKIDEVRVFNAALTATQVQRMVYQEIQNTAAQVRGLIVPKDVGSMPWANVLRYYRMDAYKDDIVDDLTTSSIDVGSGMKMYNHKLIAVQQAPMPFVTVRTGTFATAIQDTTKDIRGLDVMDYDYSIVQALHNITETANTTNLALFVNSGVTVDMTNDTKLQNDWYLQLNGKIDLTGKSQLVETANSDLEVTSSGSLERDQQGQAIKFNYNYWSSPVSTINNTTINHGFSVAGVMKDGTNASSPQSLQWTSGVNGSATSPITLSSYWIFKFQNSTNSYANWASVGQNGTLLPGQGYTMKGAGAATSNQNYTFVGKPNNGIITSTVGAGNLNLCGNPYPSAIDADRFIDDNASSLVGTLYFWEHYSTNTSHNTIQYQGGYATYTKTGGTSPVAPAGVSGLGSSSKVAKRFIPVGQGFFVTGSASGGTITFNNDQRLFIKEDNASSYSLYRTVNNTVSASPNPAMNNEEDEFEQQDFMKIHLGYNSTDNYHRQTLLGFMNQYATAGYDNGYDGISIESLTNDMYFINGTNKLNINGDGFFNANNIYPLGVKNATSGNVSFVVDSKENFEENQEIYIYDNVTNTYNSIKSGPYTVNLPAGTYDTRFSLRFTDGTALGTGDHEENHGIGITHSQSNHMINIKNPLQEVTVKSVALFNLLGQKVTEWKITNQDQSDIQLQVSDIATGTYIVKVMTDGGSVSKKILVKQ